jgi:class 3 adenylate cyclase
MAFLTTPGGLRSLARSQHCNFCSLDIECSIDDRVEVAFTVAPSVRHIRFHAPDGIDLRADALRMYFSSSLAPWARPHRALHERILVADRAPPDEVHEVELTLEAGQTVLLTPASHAAVYLDAADDESRPRAVAFDLLDGRAIPDRFAVALGRVTLRVRNRTPQPVGYIVAPVTGGVWLPPAPVGQPLPYPVLPYLTGQRLMSSQVFRELFRAESIPSEGGLELKSVTVLFTDLKGSTAIYERVGDLRAYDLVRQHFAVLRAIAMAEGGAIVKTIGDAVMASFADASGAMRAALRMSREVAGLGEGDLRLKIGMHAGACIAVELNDRLDYFGRTVNIAARVEGVAAAGEIVCTEAVYAAPGVAASATAAGFAATRADVALRGIEGEVAVVRLAPAAA